MLPRKLQLVFIFLFQLIFISLLKFKSNYEQKNIGSIEVQMSRAPHIEYENARRKIIRDTKDLLWYLESRLTNLSSDNLIETILTEAKTRKNVILSQFHDMLEHDGYNTWREKEHFELSNIVQNRIHAAQNPENCSDAKMLLCNLDSNCGFGCQFNRIVLCLIVSYATQRTMLLESRDWSYSCDGVGTFEDIYLPPSESCILHRDYDISNKEVVEWPGTENAKIIKFSFERRLLTSDKYLPLFLPPFIPDDLSDRIMRLHEDPALWWMSQFVQFLWKFQPATELMLKLLATDLQSTSVTVGIHIRRNDKILEKESIYHPIEEYMKHVKEYFDQEQIRRKTKFPKKRLYVISDDPKVFDEIRDKYPEYEVLGDKSRSHSASLKNRYSINSLLDLISDIHLLSLSDFIVCTLSSNVCRLAYEIQQQRFVDGSRNLHYLDDHWTSFILGNLIHQDIEQAVFSHEANSPKELSIDVGDKITDIKYKQNGYAFGKIEKNNQTGIYPTYKTIEVTQTHPFPTYFNIKLKIIQNSRQNKKKHEESSEEIGNLVIS